MLPPPWICRYLRRSGYGHRDPLDISSLQLLRHDHLSTVCEDVGLGRHGTKAELVARLHDLLLTLQGVGTEHPGHTDNELPASSSAAAAGAGAGGAGQQSLATAAAMESADGDVAGNAHPRASTVAEGGSNEALNEAKGLEMTRPVPEPLLRGRRRRTSTGAATPSRQAAAASDSADANRTWLMERRQASQALLDDVLDVDEIAAALTRARATDVCIIDVRGRAGFCQHFVLATGMSHRHAYTCAEAVRHQLKRRLLATWRGSAAATSTSSQSAGANVAIQSAQSVNARQLGGEVRSAGSSASAQVLSEQDILRLFPNLVGSNGSDWLAVDAGRVAVHVFTERARLYYDIEGLWGSHGMLRRVQASPSPDGRQTFTLDTLRVADS